MHGLSVLSIYAWIIHFSLRQGFEKMIITVQSSLKMMFLQDGFAKSTDRDFKSIQWQD